ncbi:MAG: histidine--tRNA ligase [Bacilli bacterium]|nr:histidine--tRNA ligase [Bacilli bacterium]
MKLKNIKGSFDFLPQEQKIRNNIMDTLKKNFEKYGYLPLETPIICYYDLLSYKYDESAEILNEIYTLTDQGNRDLGLRFDLTVPFCKVIGMQKDLRLPFRRYEIGKVFRNGPVKAGRSREFYQCDVDVVGIDNRLIEAEQINMAINTYKDLGINVKAVWNNRKIMAGLIKEASIDEELIDEVILSLDKMDKDGKEGVSSELLKKGVEQKQIEKLFELFIADLDELNNKYVETTNEILKTGLSEAMEVSSYLKYLEIEDKTKFSPFLARGLQIYTGIVFEFYDIENRLTCALGGGGRYDKIITEFIEDGNTYPAIGLSFGLEPIYMILKNEQLKINNAIDIYIIPMDTEKESLKLAMKLRSYGYRVLIEMNSKKVKKSFEYASRENIPYVIVLGKNETSNNVFKLKDMNNSKEFEIDLSKIEEIKKYIIL